MTSTGQAKFSENLLSIGPRSNPLPWFYARCVACRGTAASEAKSEDPLALQGRET